MKKLVLFLLGLFSGVILTIAVLLVVGLALQSAEKQIEGLTIFEEPAEEFSYPSYEVFQVVQGGNALARAGEVSSLGGLDNLLFDLIGEETSIDMNDMDLLGDVNYYGMVVLFLSDEATHYYDDQIIDIPKGKCVRQVGVYQYDTQSGYKTVPAVRILDK